MKFYILIFILFTQTSLNAIDIKRQQVIMGTFASISLEAKDKEEIQKGFVLFKKIEKSLSSYDKQSLLYQLNKHKVVKADKFLIEALEQSINYYKVSNFYFDISIGSITKKLYRFGEDEKIPNKQAIKKANVNMSAIKIKQNHIYIEENTTLDLGGMGKGYAVDKVANYYREQNISHGIIALSGDIQALHPTTIHIDSPFKEEPFCKLTTLHPNTSVSTSGTYRRYVKNKKHHHLINPKTKKQGRSFVSITLITKQDNALIDALATAVGVMPKNEALKFLAQQPNIGFILVRPNGNVLYGNLDKLAEFSFML